jgi:acetyltransferase-like isoleucine patch superfamily enzyme
MMWRWLDPILIKIARRMEHLALHHPSTYTEERTRQQGAISPSATITFRTSVQSLAPRDNLQIADHAHVEGEIYLLSSDSRCTIGHHTFIGPEARLWVLGTITIGNFVHIAPRVDIFDNDSHSLDAAARRQDAVNVFERRQPIDYSVVPRSPVIIEDDAWIGTKSTIVKGVRIGRGAVVAAASVVTRDVPAFTLVGGNPARELRRLDERR